MHEYKPSSQMEARKYQLCCLLPWLHRKWYRSDHLVERRRGRSPEHASDEQHKVSSKSQDNWFDYSLWRERIVMNVFNSQHQWPPATLPVLIVIYYCFQEDTLSLFSFLFYTYLLFNLFPALWYQFYFDSLNRQPKYNLRNTSCHPAAKTTQKEVHWCGISR